MLTNDQKALVAGWVAEGLTNREIIRLAAAYDPPFEIKSANITKTYRKKVSEKVQVIEDQKIEEGVRKGLADKDERIRMLEKTAEYLFDMIPNLPPALRTTLPSYVNSMRGCLDDIAKELGQRNTKVDVNANVHVKDIVKIVERVYGNAECGMRN